MRRFFLPALFVLLTCLCATGEEFVIVGDDLSGRVIVTPRGSGGGTVPVDVSVDWIDFGKKALERRIVGQGVRSEAKGRIVWSYAATVRNTGISTMVRRLLGRPPELSWKTVVFQRVGKVWTGRLAGTKMSWHAAPKTDQFAVLFVPGLSTNMWNRVGIEYLDENVATLTKRGMRARRLAIVTEASVATNAKYIKKQIELEAAAGRRVILVAHSKGGTDSTAALALYPTLRPLVAGMICIQPVYGGSPVADLVKSQRALSAAVKLVFEKVFKGELEAVTDLVRTRRRAFIAKHPYPAAQIPTIVVRSSFDRRVSRSVLWANQKLIKRSLGKASDGMVLLADQLIPGAAKTFDYKDLDHFEPGLRVESPHTPCAITHRTIDALLPLLVRSLPSPSRPKPQRLDGQLGRE